MSEQVKRELVCKIAREYSKKLGVKFGDHQFDWGQATVIEGEHEGSMADWIISWEECPDPEWVFSEDLVDVVSEVAPDVYFEAVNHWCVGFYPA